MWAVDMVFRFCPERELHTVRSNNLAGPDCSARHVHQLYEELIYGVLAARRLVVRWGSVGLFSPHQKPQYSPDAHNHRFFLRARKRWINEFMDNSS